MSRKSLGVFILYLISYTFALEIMQAIEISEPLLESNKTNVYDLEVDYSGHSECESGHMLVTRHGDSLYVVTAARGNKICEPLVAHHDVAHHLSTKRQIPNPVIASFSVNLVGGSTLTGSVTLATVAGVGALAGAVLLLWYGAKKLYGTQNEPIKASARAR